MAADHPPAYWQAVVKGLEAESEKARVYVTHGLSLGIAREAIFRRLLIDETPSPMLVRTGLIREMSSGGNISRQCDLLIYDPSINAPFYRMDDFVVVPPDMAKVVVEVKSDLQEKDLKQMIDVCVSTSPLHVPMVGFSYGGMTIDTFIRHAQTYINGDTCRLPVCIAVHDRSYLCIRPTFWQSSVELPFFMIDFTGFGAEGSAMATAYFLQWYYWLLTNRFIEFSRLKGWYNKIKLTGRQKRWLMSDGTVNEGDMP